MYDVEAYMEAIPSLKVFVQDVDFGFGEVLTCVFDIVRDRPKVQIYLRAEPRHQTTPMDRGYVCVCDLEKFYFGDEERCASADLDNSVEQWWIRNVE